MHHQSVACMAGWTTHRWGQGQGQATGSPIHAKLATSPQMPGLPGRMATIPSSTLPDQEGSVPACARQPSCITQVVSAVQRRQATPR